MQAIRFVLVFAAVVGQPAPVPGQQRAPARPSNEPQVVVRGHVVDDDSGASLARARVSSQATGVAAELSFTDTRGIFEVSVPAGSSRTLRVAKAGFVPVTVSVVAPRAVRGQEPPIEIAMIKGGVIAGRVLSDLGMPVTDARIRVRRLDVTTEAQAASSAEMSATTDDLGEYRLSGLAAGRYGVGVFGSIPPAPFVMPQGTGTLSAEQLAELNRQLREQAEARNRQKEMPLTPGDVVVEIARGQEVRLFHAGSRRR